MHVHSSGRGGAVLRELLRDGRVVDCEAGSAHLLGEARNTGDGLDETLDTATVTTHAHNVTKTPTQRTRTRATLVGALLTRADKGRAPHRW